MIFQMHSQPKLNDAERPQQKQFWDYRQFRMYQSSIDLTNSQSVDDATNQVFLHPVDRHKSVSP